MQRIQSIITETLHTLYGIESSPEITGAPKREYGEYCINVFPLAKPLGKSPNIIASEVALELAKHIDAFVSTSATGGYVNFFLTDSVWMDFFRKLPLGREYREAGRDLASEKNPQSHNDTAGQLLSKAAPKTIIVDYIGANAGKPLHIAHICTPSIGQSICNVYRHLGYRVIGDSHFGDWGGIFGKLILAWRKHENIGEDVELKLASEGVDYLLSLYQWATRIEKDLVELHPQLKGTGEELGRNEFQYLSGIGIDLSNPEELKHHEENVELWRKFTSISIIETEKKLELLNVHATYNVGESFYEGLGLPRPNGEDYPDLDYTMKDIVKELIKKGIATQNEDGSVGVIFPEVTKIPSCVLQKKDGTGLYLTSDLAAIKYRLTNGWNPEKIIYSVDVRQQLHLKQAFTIAKMAWGEELRADAVEFTHAHNGFIKLKEGAMSTRHGTVIFLEALIEEGLERTRKILEEKGRILSDENIEAITIAAIKYSYLAQDREKDVTFDWDKALNFEGHSGPYIQYAFVRAKKISESSVIGHVDKGGILPGEGTILLTHSKGHILSPYDKSLIQILTRMDEAIYLTAKTYKPHHLALYAYDLAVGFNSFYVHTPKILEESDENLKQFRLAIVSRTSEKLETIFHLLGINMPREM